MTTGEYLASLSGAVAGDTMLTVVAELEGTYPVFAPVESFSVNLVDKEFTVNLDIIAISADLEIESYDTNLTVDEYTANIIMENYDVNHTN